MAFYVISWLQFFPMKTIKRFQHVFFTLLVIMTSALIYADVGKFDFGNNSSETLTGKAWDALIEKNYEAVLAYAKKCIALYEKQAKSQQNLLKEIPAGEDIFKHWALNDVGTCYFLVGEAYFAKGKYSLARRAYEKAKQKFPFAQYYDPQGYHVKVSDSCEKKLIATEGMMGEKQKEELEETPDGRVDIRKMLKEFDVEKKKIK